MVAKKDDVQDQAKVNLEKFKKAQEGFKNSLAELKETHSWLLSEIEKLTDLKNSVEEQLSEVGALDIDDAHETSSVGLKKDEQKSEDEEPVEPVKTTSKPRRKPVKKNAAAAKEETANESEDLAEDDEKEPETDSGEEAESVAEVVEEKAEDDENLDETLGLFDEIDETKSDEKTKKDDSNEDDLDFLDF